MNNNSPQPRGRRILAVVIAAGILFAWLAVAGIGGPYFGRVSEVASNDFTVSLPAGAEATKVQERLSDFLGDETVPAIIVATTGEQLGESDVAALESAVASISGLDDVDGISPVIVSEDGLAAQIVASVDADSDRGESVGELRAILDAELPDDITAYVTGPAGLAADLLEAFSGIDGVLLLVAVIAVFIILIIVYRALLLPILVLLTSMSALCGALLTVWWLAKAEAVILTGQTQGILFILVVGAATDYCLLYVARYREELAQRPAGWTATKAAVRGTWRPVLASGSTVIAGLLCLLVSTLGSNRSLGPVAAIGIVFAMLASLTLLPALLLLTGRAAYWPRKLTAVDADALPVASGYARIGRKIAQRPRTVWIVSTAVLLIGAGFVVTFKADGVNQSEFVLTQSDARDGEQLLTEHFPGGSGTPAYVLTAEDDLDAVAEILLQSDGVAAVDVTAADSPRGSVPVSDIGQDVQPTVVDGDVLFQLTLGSPADSAEAQATIAELRSDLERRALVGGTTAVSYDTNQAAMHDRNVIIPLVLVVILVILMVLLKAMIAPLILVAATVVSFGTAMGVAAIVFNHVLDLPGADPTVPLFGFVFLVALGIDYTIFLMTRVREESYRHSTHDAVIRSLALTGGVITSAGIVLAATFAALAVIPILFLAQLAFIVAFGVLLDTLLVRTLVIPAISLDVGDRLWWPWRKKAEPLAIERLQ